MFSSFWENTFLVITFDHQANLCSTFPTVCLNGFYQGQLPYSHWWLQLSSYYWHWYLSRSILLLYWFHISYFALICLLSFFSSLVWYSQNSPKADVETQKKKQNKKPHPHSYVQLWCPHGADHGVVAHRPTLASANSRADSVEVC